MGFFSFGGIGDGLVRDPVCGKRLPSEEARYSTEHRGRLLIFCSSGCKFSFKRRIGIEATRDYLIRKRMEEEAKRLAIRASRSNCSTCTH